MYVNDVYVCRTQKKKPMPECVGMAAPLPGAGSPNLSPLAAAPQLAGAAQVKVR